MFTLAVYILPFFVALNAGFWAYHSGAGVLGTAWTRLTILTEPRPLDSNAAVGGGPQSVLTAAAQQK
jgi:hypothetical protein